MDGPHTISELHELASRPDASVCDCLKSLDGNVMVVGAGGKMGFHLTRMIQRGLQQIDSPRRVIAVSRFSNPKSVDRFHEAGIETIATDLTKDAAITALPESDNIYYLAGVKFGTSDEPERLQQINVELPFRFGKRFRHASIVALSTGCVYPFVDRSSGGSVETDTLAPPGEYARSCLGREQAFVDSGAKTSLVRLNYSVDLRYGVLLDLANRVNRGLPIDLTTGFVNVIWQGDANRYIVRSITRATAPPYVLNVTGTRILKVREVAERFGELFERQVTFTGTETETAWLNNASKCHRLFGKPVVTEAELIDWVADWIMRDGEQLNQPTHFEVRDGNY